MKIIGELTSTSLLVQWDQIRKGYAVDEPIRRMLAVYEKLEQPDRYKKISQKAEDIYQQWIERNAENRSIYIKEEFFHRINLSKSDQQDSSVLMQELENRLKKYLGTYYQKDLSLSNQLYEEFSKDTEIESLMGEKDFIRLSELIQNHMKTIDGFRLVPE
jgi:hypothetical protein